MTNNSMSSTSCSISTLNNQAISLVQQGQSRNAIKLFLQALSQLKSEVCRSTGSSCNHGQTTPTLVESPFVRVSVSSSQDGESTEETTAAFAMFDTLLALNPKVDSCAPQQRDGTTACLLYNMALSHQRMSESNPNVTTNDSSKTCLHLKKAARTYTMAFSAAQHWKRWTKEHPGFPVLQVAILNNLLGLHAQLGNATKVQQLQTCFREALASANATLSQDEQSFFATNLEQQMNSPAVVAASSQAAPQSLLLGRAA